MERLIGRICKPMRLKAEAGRSGAEARARLGVEGGEGGCTKDLKKLIY
jgi:hypothetical protein